MKKNNIILLTLLSISIILTGCAKKTHTNTEASKSVKESNSYTSKTSNQSEKSSSIESSSEDADLKPSGTIKTSDTKDTDLAKARMALYTAGISSADISDEQIAAFWNEAKNKNIDFVEYFKSLEN